MINSVPFQTQAESWSVGGTRARITLSVFRKLPCIIPPLELMNKFDDLVSTLFEKMEQAKIQLLGNAGWKERQS